MFCTVCAHLMFQDFEARRRQNNWFFLTSLLKKFLKSSLLFRRNVLKCCCEELRTSLLMFLSSSATPDKHISEKKSRAEFKKFFKTSYLLRDFLGHISPIITINTKATLPIFSFMTFAMFSPKNARMSIKEFIISIIILFYLPCSASYCE